MSRRCNLLVFVAAAVVVIAGVRYAQPFLVPVLFGASLAAISSPVATWVTRRGLPSAVGALAALLVDVALLAFMGTMLALAGNELQTRMPAYMARLAGVVVPLAAALSRWGIPVNAAGLSSALHVDGMFSMLGDAAMEVAGALSSLAMVLLLVFFTLCEFTGVGDKISLLTRDRDGALVRIDRIVRQVQRYLVVKTLTSFGVALLAFILLRCLRVDVALLLALVLFLLRFIPNVGAVVGTIPALLVAFASRGPGVAVAVGLGYVLINVLVGNVVESRVLGRTLGLSPLVVLLGMLFWGWLWGASGALLSVPLMMVGKIILENSKDLAWIARLVEPAPDARERALPRRSPTNPLMTRPSVPIGLGSSVREPVIR
jgi:AI-2 transport protein TqsA